MTLLRLPWVSPGSFFFLFGRGGFSFARGGREEGSLIFLSFPLQLRIESLFIYSPLGFDAIILFLFMRGRVFLVVAPRVFYMGGFSVSAERVRFFSLFPCNWGGDPYLSGTSVKWN